MAKSTSKKASLAVLFSGVGAFVLGLCMQIWYYATRVDFQLRGISRTMSLGANSEESIREIARRNLISNFGIVLMVLGVAVLVLGIILLIKYKKGAKV